MLQGNPIDLIPNNVIIELRKQIEAPSNHRYPLNESEGYMGLREQVSQWYNRKYKVALNPVNEVGILIGSKEGILYFLLSQVSKGDYVLITNPCYQTYKFLIEYIGAVPLELNIGIENNFLPDFENVPESILSKTKAIIINYPNNPTCAVASKDFFNKLIDFAIFHNIKIVNDNPYLEYVTQLSDKLSILESKRAKEVCIELNSFSKTFCMAGWRLGMIAGNKEIIFKMMQIKKMVDAGPFLALQKAAICALDEDCDIYIENLTKKFALRKKMAIEEFIKLGWNYEFQKGTYYVWLPCRDTHSSIEYCHFLEKEANILATPGLKYGTNGEGFIRMSLAIEEEDFQDVLHRFNKLYY